MRFTLGQVSSLPAIRAVRNLKLTLQSNLVVRPLKSRPGSSSSEVNTSQPPGEKPLSKISNNKLIYDNSNINSNILWSYGNVGFDGFLFFIFWGEGESC